uniref:Metacaspase 1 n=1 Tax=Rhizophora mucronata TaxID=61149 RepID=A0A2P2KTP0_RHIMU
MARSRGITLEMRWMDMTKHFVR